MFKNNYRNKFPLLKKSRITYLDSAATTQKPKEIIDAIKEFYEKYNANPHRGIYKLSEKATELLEASRKKTAELINAEKQEIIFTKSATEGFNMLANSLRDEIGRWNNIVVTEMEHHSNFVPWQMLAKKTQAQFRTIKYDAEKHKLESINQQVDKRTAIVSITMMSNVTGYIPKIKETIQEIRNINEKTIIILDATQYIAHKDLDIREFDADFICFSAHKIYGPTGVGIVYGKKEHLQKISPFNYGGNMINQVKKEESTWAEPPNKFEAGTIDTAGIYAFGKAIDYLKNKKERYKREEDLKNYALKKLREIKNIKIIGHTDENYGPIISMHITDLHPHDLAEICSRENIAIRAGHHCCQPLMHALELPATARISLSFYNDKKDIDKFVKAIEKARKIING